MADARRVDWAPVRNPFGKTLAPPLMLDRREDGRLARKSFPGWVGYRRGEASPVRHAAATAFHGRPADHPEWLLKAPGGMDVLAAAAEAGDADISMKLDLGCAAGGLAFRLDDEGGGLFVELAPGSREVSLVKWLPERNARTGNRGYRREVLQSETMYAPFPAGEATAARLLCVGPYVEVSVRGEVVLATFTGERLTGRWGIWAESGPARAEDVRLAQMRLPG